MSDRMAGPDVDRLTFIASADLSLDGSMVAYTTLTPTDGDDEVSLWLVGLDAAGEAQRIDVDGAPAGVRWSPDGTEVAVVATVDDRRQVVLVDVATGGARQLTTFPSGILGSPAWSPDGATIAVGVVQAVRADRTEPYAVERLPWQIDGMGEVADVLADIHLVDRAGGAARALTGGPSIDLDPRWSADGQALLFVRTNEARDLEPMDRHVVVDLEGREAAVPWPGGMFAAGCFTPTGDVISTAYRQADQPRGTAPDLWVMRPDGEVENRSAGLDAHLAGSVLAHSPTGILSPGRFVGLHDGDALLTELVGGEQRIVRVAIEGRQERTTVLGGPMANNPLTVRGDSLLYASSSMNEPADLHLLDLHTGHRTRVTAVNAGRLPAPLEVTELSVISADGTAIEAWFLTEAGAERPAPTVLLIHGGPFAAYGHAFDVDAQHLARAGYGVLMANPRGSLGYGSAFGTATRGAWGQRDHEDLVAVVDHAIEAGLVDGERLGVHGLSYGGYMTAWLVTHSDRFRAAVAENPLIDFRSMRGTSDIGITFTNDVLGGSLAEVPDRYVECSPLTYAHRCTTPTRLIVGESDHRCPPSQAEQFHSALRETGCPTDMVRLPGASHGGSSYGRPAVRRAKHRALIEWLDRYLGAGS